MPPSKSNKLQQIINYRVRVVLQDSRMFVGTFKAFDKHMNVILADCDEYRRLKGKGESQQPREEKRIMGFVLCRGDNIVSITPEGPPPPEEGMPRLPLQGGLPGPGSAHPMGRGMPPPMPRGPQTGIPGMAHGAYTGIGAPSAGMMQPNFRG